MLSPLDPAIDLDTVYHKQSSEEPAVPVLYHYTNTSGLLGILQDASKAEIWATHHEYLNDRSEFVYAQGVLSEVIQARLDSERHDLVRAFLGLVAEESERDASPIYVACFCERDDLLNQWRDYAGEAGGWALGFDTRALSEDAAASVVEDDPQCDFELVRVIYDRQKQMSHIGALLDVATAAVHKYVMNEAFDSCWSYDVMLHCRTYFMSVALRRMLAFKHPAYAVEHEWRLCHTPVGEIEYEKYRVGRYGITPYVALDIAPIQGAYTHRMPLVSVTIGPTLNLLNSERALSGLLRSRKFKDITIRPCELPVRLS